jgi:hypothetical protein
MANHVKQCIIKDGGVFFLRILCHKYVKPLFQFVNFQITQSN